MRVGTFGFRKMVRNATCGLPTGVRTATCGLSVTCSPKKYPFIAAFAGDTNYAASSVNAVFSINSK
jgi:hypothetical protein